MSKKLRRPLAPHVQAAIQLKLAGSVSGPKVAPYVKGAMQPKVTVAGGAPRVALHVQAAITGAMQLKVSGDRDAPKRVLSMSNIGTSVQGSGSKDSVTRTQQLLQGEGGVDANTTAINCTPGHKTGPPLTLVSQPRSSHRYRPDTSTRHAIKASDCRTRGTQFALDEDVMQMMSESTLSEPILKVVRGRVFLAFPERLQLEKLYTVQDIESAIAIRIRDLERVDHEYQHLEDSIREREQKRVRDEIEALKIRITELNYDEEIEYYSNLLVNSSIR